MSGIPSVPGSYTVKYFANGEAKTIRRTIPPKMHNIIPEDVVQLNVKRSDDFVEGGNYRVKNINPRHPNVLQLVDKEGDTTFVSYFQVKANKKSTDQKEVQGEQPIGQDYLLWP